MTTTTTIYRIQYWSKEFHCWEKVVGTFDYSSGSRACEITLKRYRKKYPNLSFRLVRIQTTTTTEESEV